MKIRRRLGVLATAVSGLLAAGLLLSAPALAWNKGTELKDVSASCPPGSGQDRVEFTLKLFAKGHSGHLEASYRTDEGDWQDIPDDELLNEGDQPGGTFGEEDQELKLHFFVPSPSEEGSQIVLRVKVVFDDSDEEVVKYAKADLEKCEAEETTTTTSTTTTTTTTTPSSSEAPTTAAGPALPFTGSNALPMLIAALGMVVGGIAALFAGRVRGRHAK